MWAMSVTWNYLFLHHVHGSPTTYTYVFYTCYTGHYIYGKYNDAKVVNRIYKTVTALK